MDRAQLNQLKQAIANIDRLPAKNGIRVETQKIYDQLPDRDKLLGEINREISKGISGAVPIIKSIAFNTSLGLVDAGSLDATVSYARTGKHYTADLTLDISDPAKTTQQLLDAFVGS